MARKLLFDVTRPPSPFDSVIEALMLNAGRRSYFEGDRALTVLELYRQTDCPEPDDIPSDVSIRQVELWWEHFTQFRDAILEAPLTDTPAAAVKLKLLRRAIDEETGDELGHFDAIVGYLARDAKTLDLPECPYQDATEGLLFRFGKWGDQDLADAAEVAIAYRAWLLDVMRAMPDGTAHRDEIHEHLYLRLWCLADAIRIAPVAGPLGAAAKLRLLLDQDADDLNRYDKVEVLTSVLAGLEKSIGNEVELREAA
jgi:hypothetical protein